MWAVLFFRGGFKIMKKKAIFLIVSAIFVIAAISGTTAYFVKEFTSDDNVATAATFDVDVVDADGNTISDGQFNLDEDLYPGMDTLIAYQFDVLRNNTELPYEYSIDFSQRGELFPEDGNSPLVVTMQKQVGEDWLDIDFQSTFVPEDDVEAYRILVDWPHGDNDIDFQGATGTLTLNVVATQVDMPVVPEETGEVQFTLYKDQMISMYQLDIDHMTSVYLQSKDTGLTYEGDITRGNRAVMVFSDVPIGEYTMHIEYPDGMYIHEFIVNNGNGDEDYDAETNPIVVKEDERSQAKMALRSEAVIDQINHFDTLRVPSTITLEEFKEELPKEGSIVDTNGVVHYVEIEWNIQESAFYNIPKPGQVTIQSEQFTLPLEVSNTERAQSLRFQLPVYFQ